MCDECARKEKELQLEIQKAKEIEIELLRTKAKESARRVLETERERVRTHSVRTMFWMTFVAFFVSVPFVVFCVHADRHADGETSLNVPSPLVATCFAVGFCAVFPLCGGLLDRFRGKESITFRRYLQCLKEIDEHFERKNGDGLNVNEEILDCEKN